MEPKDRFKFFMNKILFILISLFLSSPAYAYKVTASVGYGLDQVGVQASSDVSIACASGDVMVATGPRDWRCIASASSMTAPAGSNTEVQYNNAGSFGASDRFKWDGSKLIVSGNATGVLGSVYVPRGDVVNQYIVLQESALSSGSAYLTFKGSGGNAIAMGAIFAAGAPLSYTFTDPSGVEVAGINTGTGVLSASGNVTVAGVSVCRADGTNCPASSAGNTIRISEDGVHVVSADTVNFTTGLKATTAASGKATVSADMATVTTPGIASFDTTNFTVGAFGGVSIKNGGVDLASEVTGTLPAGNGGTGASSGFNHGFIPIGNGTGFTLASIVSGSNITVTNTSGQISIASTGGSGTACSGGHDTAGFSATNYEPLYGGGANTTSTNTDEAQWPIARTVTSWRACVDVAPGAGQNWTVSMQEAGTPNTVSCTIVETAECCSATGLSEAVPADTKLNVKFNEDNGGAATTAGESWTWCYTT